MFIGHFAAGLAIRSKSSTISTTAILVGVGFLDILYSVFIALKIEHVSKGSFEFIDWSHSLLMSLIWSALFATIFFKKGVEAMLAAALAVFSHFLLDLIAHKPDLALYPYSTVHWGMAHVLGKYEWWIELVISLLFLSLYLRLFSKQKNVNVYSISIVIFLVTLHVLRRVMGM